MALFLPVGSGKGANFRFETLGEGASAAPMQRNKPLATRTDMAEDDLKITVSPQQFSIDVMLEKYAKGDETRIEDIYRRGPRRGPVRAPGAPGQNAAAGGVEIFLR